MKFKIGDRVKCNHIYSFDPSEGAIIRLPTANDPRYGISIINGVGPAFYWSGHIWNYPQETLELLGRKIKVIKQYGIVSFLEKKYA